MGMAFLPRLVLTNSADIFKKKGMFFLEWQITELYAVLPTGASIIRFKKQENSWPQEPDLEGGCFSE